VNTPEDPLKTVHPASRLGIDPLTESARGWRAHVWPWRSEARELAGAWRSEADHLARLILLRLQYPDDDGAPWTATRDGVATDARAIAPWQQEFVYHRFSSRIRWYARRYPYLVRVQTILALIVVAAGLGTSGITALDTGSGTWNGWPYVVIILGVVVGVFTGLSQIWKPGQKALSYCVGQLELRQEGWDFVQKRGEYKASAYPHDAFGLFAERVASIERQALAVDLQGAGQPA
jgi:hypothetical protein